MFQKEKAAAQADCKVEGLQETTNGPVKEEIQK